MRKVLPRHRGRLCRLALSSRVPAPLPLRASLRALDVRAARMQGREKWGSARRNRPRQAAGLLLLRASWPSWPPSLPSSPLFLLKGPAPPDGERSDPSESSFTSRGLSLHPHTRCRLWMRKKRCQAQTDCSCQKILTLQRMRRLASARHSRAVGSTRADSRQQITRADHVRCRCTRDRVAIDVGRGDRRGDSRVSSSACDRAAARAIALRDDRSQLLSAIVDARSASIAAPCPSRA